MQLNKQSKNELRKRIVEQLKEVPKGQKIKLDKELLEYLLFEVITLDKTTDTKVKLPIWSGEFLKKIDLSQVDFTNVSWCILDYKESDYKIDFDDITISDKNIYDTIDIVRSEKKEEYEQMKNEIFDSILKSIEEQVNHMKM